MIAILCGTTGLIVSLLSLPFALFLGYLGVSACFARLELLINRNQIVRSPIPDNSVSNAGDEPKVQNHLTVIVPAHNERLSIKRTVESILSCGWPRKSLRVLVIADNCTDETAALATAAGADVYVRSNEQKRSKGFALEEVFSELTNPHSTWFAPTAGFVIIDADAVPNSGFFEAVMAAIKSGSDFGQCLNLVRNANESWRTELMTIAFALFNGAYLLGLKAAGLSGHLRGNGIFFSFRGACRRPWRASSLAEDLEFSWILKVAGEHIDFVVDAIVQSDMPDLGHTAKSQRARWEHGRKALRNVMTKPVFASRYSIGRRLLMLLELWLPAFSALALVCSLGLVLGSAAVLFDASGVRWQPVQLLSLINLLCLGAYVSSAFICGIVPFKSLLALRYAPFYALWRLVTVVTSKPVSWVRTSRSMSDKPLGSNGGGFVDSSPLTLINLGDYYGSIAAARCLGDDGHRVFFGDHRNLVPGKWSRFVTKRLASPDLWNRPWSETLQWINDVGAQYPGIFFYPTCDDLCYLVSRERESLGSNFLLYAPSVAATMSLLDKKKLAEAAAKCGLATPVTFAPNSQSALDSLSKELSYRILIKPRTQVGLTTRGKGQICDNPRDLHELVARFLTTERYRDEILSYDRDLAWPMIQKFHPAAVDGMISVAGFVSHDSDEVIAYSSKKVFQRPRRLGVGIAFEGIEPDPDLVKKLGDLCKMVEYFGIFEAEFVTDEQTGQSLLVDFNPRYYGQMAFEIARGLRLPSLAYEAAVRMHKSTVKGNPQAKVAGIAKSGIENGGLQNSRYALGWNLKLMLCTQFLGRRLSVQEFLRWRQWLRTIQKQRFDAIYRQDDRKPWLVELLSHSIAMLAHPRDTFRKLFLG